MVAAFGVLPFAKAAVVPNATKKRAVLSVFFMAILFSVCFNYSSNVANIKRLILSI